MELEKINRQNMDAALDIDISRYEVSLISRSAPILDKTNEDTGAVLGDGNNLVALVADGAGGYKGGRDASELATETLIRSIKGATSSPMQMRIMQGFEQAHEAIRDSDGNAATTMAAAYVSENSLRTFHVGDSAILVIGGRGRLKYQTSAHSPTGYAIEAGTLNENDALFHEDRNLVSNILGYEPFSIESSAKLALAKRDTVLIASDGLFDNLYVYEICQIACKRPIKKACDSLAEAALTRMITDTKDVPHKSDDVTIVLIRLVP